VWLFDNFNLYGTLVLYYVLHKILLPMRIDSVKKLCDRAILLDKGKIESIGEPRKVVDDYLRILNAQNQR